MLLRRPARPLLLPRRGVGDGVGEVSGVLAQGLPELLGLLALRVHPRVVELLDLEPLYVGECWREVVAVVNEDGNDQPRVAVLATRQHVRKLLDAPSAIEVRLGP